MGEGWGGGMSPVERHSNKPFPELSGCAIPPTPALPHKGGGSYCDSEFWQCGMPSIGVSGFTSANLAELTAPDDRVDRRADPVVVRLQRGLHLGQERLVGELR